MSRCHVASASVLPCAEGPANQPVAVQLLGKTHETPARALKVAPAGSGVAWIAHVVPFQCSARTREPPETVAYHPAAVQLVSEAHEMLSSWLSPAAWAGLGVAWIAHAVPFQRSASVTVGPDLLR